MGWIRTCAGVCGWDQLTAEAVLGTVCSGAQWDLWQGSPGVSCVRDPEGKQECHCVLRNTVH